MKKVVFHIDDVLNWNMVIANVQNMLTYYTQKKMSFHIEILANGKAVGEYKAAVSKYSQEFDMLAKNNVFLAACNNSLSGLKITEEELFDFVTIVPSGVVELVKKQNEGYAYIKP